MKKVLIALLVVLVIIQFIRPEKNKAQGPFLDDISVRYPMPDSVHAILQKACFDCHSNNTVYPWYDQVQPTMWWITSHVNEGKRDFNFNEFLTYKISRQYKRVTQSIDAINKGWMPISSYTFVHRNAVLNEGEKKVVTDWFASIRDDMKAHYPADSLKSPAKKKS